MLARMVGKKLFSHLYFKTLFGVDIASSFVFFFPCFWGMKSPPCGSLYHAFFFWSPTAQVTSKNSISPPLTIWWSVRLKCHFCPLQILRLGLAFRLLQVSFSVLAWTMDGRTSSLGTCFWPHSIRLQLPVFGMLPGRNRFCPLRFGFQGLFFL